MPLSTTLLRSLQSVEDEEKKVHVVMMLLRKKLSLSVKDEEVIFKLTVLFFETKFSVQVNT